MLQRNTGGQEYSEKFIKSVRIGIVTSNYHYQYTGSMERACVETLLETGVLKDHIHQYYAPGTWEVPVICDAVLQKGEVDALVVFGVVLKGETLHFDIISLDSSRALMDLSLQYHVPIANEILAVFDIRDAEKRTSSEYNKGIEGAHAALSAAEQIQKL